MKKFLFSFLLFFIISCISDLNPKTIEVLGKWGGQGVQLEINENSSNFEFDCASASINSRLKTTDNQIDIQFGTFTYEHGGPIKVDEKPDIHPAQFKGEIIQDSMTVIITILDQKRADQIFKLKKGENGRIFKCL